MADHNIGKIFVELDLDPSRYMKGQQQLLKDATTTTLNIEKNFKNLGIKSSAEMDLMRQKINNSFNMIANNAKATANDILRAEEAKNAKLKALNDQQYGAHVSMGDKIKKNWLEVTAAIAAAYGAFSIGKAAIDAALKMEQITYAMKAVSGSSQIAAQEMSYIRAESERLGLVMSDSALAFAKFAAATRNTAIEGQETKKVFSAVAEAATALKLPGEQVNGIFMALQQMMSKGKVQAEELRGQLGERLPGAFQMAAEAMGVTTAELNKMLEDGKVLGSELLPKLAEKLHETYGTAATESAQGGQAAINRFNNAVFESKAALGDAMMPALSGVIDLLKIGIPYVKAFIGGLQLLTADIVGFVDKFNTMRSNFASPATMATHAMFGTDKWKSYQEQKRQIDANVEATKQDIMTRFGEKPKAPNYSLAYDAGTYTYSAPESKGKKKGGGGGGADNYANTLRQITDETKAWADKIAELNPELDKEDNAILKLTNDADKLIKKIQDQAGKSKKQQIDTADQIASIQAGLEQGIAYISEKNFTKLYTEYEKLIGDEVDYGLNENERAANAIIAKEEEKMNKLKDLWWEGVLTEEEYDTAASKIHSNAMAAKLDKDTEYASKVARLNYDAIHDIIGMEEDAFKLKMKLIDAEAAKRRKDGADEVSTARWAENQKQLALVDYARKSDSVTAGIGAAWYDLYRKQMSWGEAAYQVVTGWYEQMGDAAGEGLFDVLTGDLENLSDLWDDTWKSMLKTLTKTLGKMAMEAVQKDIVLLFKSEWTEGGSNVLGIVNSVLGFAGSLFGGGSFSGGGGLFSGAGASGDWYDGGWVPGYAYGGNSPSNDTVRAMLSPGEFVVDRETIAGMGRNGDSMIAHINPVEAALLKTLGGSGTINPRTGLPEFYTSVDEYGQWDEAGYQAQIAAQRTNAAAYIASQPAWARPLLSSFGLDSPWITQVKFAGLSDGRIMAAWNPPGSTVQDMISYVNANPETDLSLSYITPSTGAYTPMQYYEGVHTPSTFMSEYGGYISAGLGLIGGPLLGMIASLAVGAATVANDDGVNWSDVLPGMGMSVAGGLFSMFGGYKGIGDMFGSGASTSATIAQEATVAQGMGELIAEAAEQYPSNFAGSIYESGWGNLASAGLDMATNMVFKQAIKYAIGSMLGGGEASNAGQMRLSYEGANDSGLLASLAGQMQGLGGSYAFSARNGLDYVPYDNFPAVLHKGEKVKTAKAAENEQLGNEVLYQIAKNTGKMAKILSRFDDNGLPDTRTLV